MFYFVGQISVFDFVPQSDLLVAFWPLSFYRKMCLSTFCSSEAFLFLILERSPLENAEQIVPLFCVPFDEIGTNFPTTWERNGPLLLKGEPIVPNSQSRTEQSGP